MIASRTLLLLLLVPVLATGCGSSSQKTVSAPTRLTQAQFVSAANAVCIKSDKRVFQLGRLSLLPGPWGLTAVAAHEGILEMSFLDPPAKSEAGFRHLLVLGRRLETGIQQVHDALAKKEYKVARDAQVRATRADTAIHLQAKKLGLTFCQQILTNWPA